jgi:hypothetical protein
MFSGLINVAVDDIGRVGSLKGSGDLYGDS